MNIYSLSLIIDLYHLGSFVLNFYDVKTAKATDTKMVSNERKSNYLPFETNLASSEQAVFNERKLKKKMLYTNYPT